MLKYKVIAMAAVAALILAVAGFDRDSKVSPEKKAPVAPATVNAELAKVKATLAETQKERDALKDELEKVKSEQALAAEALAQRNDAVARLQQSNADYILLLTQLQDQTQKTLVLQRQVNDMHATINVLLHRLNGATVMPKPSLNGATVMPYPRL